MWDICPNTNKPEVNTANLWKLRAIVGGTAFGAVIVAGKVVPWIIGFDMGGILPNSIAAWWQSSLGNVAANSVFAKLTSLTMTGKGLLLFGGTGGGLALLAGLVAAKKLDWCTCEYDRNKKE